MPYAHRKKKIPRELDRRVKLSDENRERLLKLRGQISQRVAAQMFKISRSLVRFIWMPEKLEHAKQLYQERRKDGRYYPGKTRRAKQMREHRRYKQKIKEKLI